jgi:membrane protein implicated in regulation of membrane protease activity
MTFIRFCKAAQKSASILAFIISWLNIFAFASSGLKLFLHEWRWPIITLLSLCIVILIVDRRSRKRSLKEPSYVR